MGEVQGILARRAEAHLEAKWDKMGGSAEAETLSDPTVGCLVLQNGSGFLGPWEPPPTAAGHYGPGDFRVDPKGQRWVPPGGDPML